MKCLLCGECCFANGLIPPYLPGEDAPEWFAVMIQNLRGAVADIAEEFHCVFLKPDMTCAIHSKRWRPAVCRDFVPGDCPGYRKPEDTP